MKQILLLMMAMVLVGCGKASKEKTEQVPTFLDGAMKRLFEGYTKDAEKGDANAQFNLGWHYENGEGVPRDYVAAYAWYNIAASKQELDDLAKKMTPEQITKAKELSREMVKKNPKLLPADTKASRAHNSETNSTRP